MWKAIAVVAVAMMPATWAMPGVPSALAEVRYTVTDLGPGEGADINNAGQVVGTATLPGGTARHAFLYSDGIMTDLGTLGGTVSNAYGINQAGQVVGRAALSGGLTHAFLYSGGVMTDLGTLGGQLSLAGDINSAGQVVGDAETNGGGYHAFLYGAGTMTDLGTMGGSRSQAMGINDAGQIVGWADHNQSCYHAFLYQDGTMIDLGALGDGPRSSATAINRDGLVVGWAVDGRTYYERAFLYAGGTMADLGALNGRESHARDVNNIGQIVGDSAGLAFLYENGIMTDLNSLIDPASGWTLQAAYGINDPGQIVGYGRNSLGTYRAFLLTPIPEPATVGLLAAGLGGLLVRRKRRRTETGRRAGEQTHRSCAVAY